MQRDSGSVHTTPAQPAAAPLKVLVEQARAEVARRHAEGESGDVLAKAYAQAVDRIVGLAFEAALAKSPVDGATLVAVGGLGRNRMAPFADVDLWLVVPEAQGERGADLARELFTPLWDTGLELGTALRTQAEALAAAEEDHTVATALVDARIVAGDREAGTALIQSFWTRWQGERREALIQAKVDELQDRRRRFGESVYLLEPNVKMGVGGLRDLAAALWVAQLRHRARGLTGVQHFGLLPRRELDAVRAARELLLRLRCGLHLRAKRRDDRLTFAAQESLAKAFGYADTTEALAVEQLMRDYYVAAQGIEHAADSLIDRCTHESRPRRTRPARARSIAPFLEVWDERVTLSDSAAVASHPSLLVELFVAAERERLPVHSRARDIVAQECARRGASLVDCEEARDALLDYLQSPGADGSALSGMYVTGVLGGLFPAFARLRGLVQHDVYHVYTVDTHTLLALQKLLRLRAGLLAAEQPVFTRLVQDLPRPLSLYVGLFFHDLGKGLGGDHSQRGEAIVREWGERAGLDAEVVDDAAFLVREHLSLSKAAFRRDISDPALLERVARMCGTSERLDMLYLLTWADISSVGPETWNAWRAQLLEQLHAACRSRFDAPHRTLDRSAAATAGARALQASITDPLLESFIDVLPERYLATVAPATARAHFDLWKRASGRLVTGGLFGRPVAQAGRLAVIAPDRPGLLADIAGTLAAHGIDILGAEIFSLHSGQVLDSFVVREPGDRPPEPARVQAALDDLERVVAGQESASDLLRRRRAVRSLAAAGPAVPVKLRFDLHASPDATVVDVSGPDRPGLLHDLARALHSAQTTIVLARVATEGQRAVDSFYLQDLQQRKVVEPERLEEIQRSLTAALRPD